jgi:hypothetical protein
MNESGRRATGAVWGSWAGRNLYLTLYGLRACWGNVVNLLGAYGFLRSAFRWESADRQGNPIPWFSYPAIEYLDQLDLTGCTLFEYGCGFSTLYWSRRCRRVHAVENNAAWHARISAHVGPGAAIRLVDSDTAFIRAIADVGETFDVIIVDGAALRLECAQAARPFLKEGGFIILDDSCDNLDAAEFLRSSDLVEVDFAGFNAINRFTKTTSLFLHPRFRPKGRHARFPEHSLCCCMKPRG